MALGPRVAVGFVTAIKSDDHGVQDRVELECWRTCSGEPCHRRTDMRVRFRTVPAFAAPLTGRSSDTKSATRANGASAANFAVT
jgi:hypothetical protein